MYRAYAMLFIDQPSHYTIILQPIRGDRPQTGSEILTHSSTLNVKAMSLRHNLTANERRCKQILGDALTRCLFYVNLWNFPIDYLHVAPSILNRLRRNCNRHKYLIEVRCVPSFIKIRQIVTSQMTKMLFKNRFFYAGGHVN